MADMTESELQETLKNAEEFKKAEPAGTVFEMMNQGINMMSTAMKLIENTKIDTNDAIPAWQAVIGSLQELITNLVTLQGLQRNPGEQAKPPNNEPVPEKQSDDVQNGGVNILPGGRKSRKRRSRKVSKKGGKQSRKSRHLKVSKKGGKKSRKSRHLKVSKKGGKKSRKSRHLKVSKKGGKKSKKRRSRKH